MSKDVFKCLYEVPADHPAVAAHCAAVDVAAAATRAYVESVGALGYRTSSWSGSLASVIFADGAFPPEHWKILDREWHPTAAKAYACIPKKTKAAEAVREAFDAVPAIPQTDRLAIALGWSGAQPTDGRKIHFATVQRLTEPTPRVIVQIPRQIDDGWTPPDFFTEITVSQHMAAIAAHNALVPEETND